MAHICNPSTPEAEAGGPPEVQGQPGLHSETLSPVEPVTSGFITFLRKTGSAKNCSFEFFNSQSVFLSFFHVFQLLRLKSKKEYTNRKDSNINRNT